jgi:small subunit ribosomal protein S1
MSPNESSTDFASLFEAQASIEPARADRPRALALGQRCRAEVVQLGRDVVFVEVLDRTTLGKRQQAYLNVLDVRAPSGELTLKVGDVIEAVVVELDRSSGEMRLGYSMGRPETADALTNAYAAGVAVEGKVSGVNKGGLEVEVAGVRAFCPTSQIDRGYVADPQTLIGRTLQFRVTEVRDGGKSVVLSRRAVLEEEYKRAAAQTLTQLTPGAVVRGTVTAVREFGAFVDLGGIEGLIPNAELSYDRSKKANDVLTPGDVVEVQVREVREGVLSKRGEPTTKITLSLKALAGDPWENIEAHAPEGKVVRGTVTRLLDFGAFVQLTPGIEGLLHVSELGGKVLHPSAVLKVGEQLTVVVRAVDKAARKISLVPAPDGLAVGADAQTPTLIVGSIVTGTVDRIESYGVFLQVEGTRGRVGRGLIPNAELGVPRGADLRKLFALGKTLSAKVLETGDGKLRLSLKAIEADQERADFDGYREATATAAKMGTFADLFKKK